MGSGRRLALLVLLAIVYALCYSIIKAGLAHAPPLRFAGLRAVGGGAVLIAYLAVLDGDRIVPPRSAWAGTAALAAVGTVVLYAAMFLSPGAAGAGVSSVLGNTGPLFAVVLAALFLGEPLTTLKVSALLVALAGVTLVVYPAATATSASGVLAAAVPITAAAAAAASAVLLKWLRVGDALVSVVAWQLLLGGGVLLALSFPLEAGQGILWAPRFAGYLAFLSIAGTAFAVAAWYWLVQREDVGRISILLMVLVPVLGLWLARVIHGEPIRPRAGVGVALAMAGLLLATIKDMSPERSAREPDPSGMRTSHASAGGVP